VKGSEAMKVWKESKIKKLIDNNDTFILHILMKLNEFDLLKYNEFLSSVHNFYCQRGFLSKKQIIGLRNIFKHQIDVITKMANGERIYFSDIYIQTTHDPVKSLEFLARNMLPSETDLDYGSPEYDDMNQLDFIG
jgi:hypothetical protein